MKVSVFHVFIVLFGVGMLTTTYAKPFRAAITDDDADVILFFNKFNVKSHRTKNYDILQLTKSDEESMISNTEELVSSLKLIDALIKKEINNLLVDERAREQINANSELKDENSAASADLIKSKPKRNRGILNLPLGFGK